MKLPGNTAGKSLPRCGGNRSYFRASAAWFEASHPVCPSRAIAVCLARPMY